MSEKPEHIFPYRWKLAEGYPAKGIAYHGAKVFGTFICGGGSTMGYKLAGYEHLGGVEIDPKIADVYKENHKPKHLFVQDIRVFNKKEDLPAELYDLDLLDGSPPCSTFSMAGSREKAWGKKKQFREGQAVQVLDDLVFEYVRTIDKLKPKVCLLENVRGIIQGNAKVYSKEIVRQMTAAGYRVQVFLLNAASMGVPQKRERVFFIGLRNDFDLPELVLRFNEKAVITSELSNVKGDDISDFDKDIFLSVNFGEKDFVNACFRRGKQYRSRFNTVIVYDTDVPPTITSTSGSKIYHAESKSNFSDEALKQIGTYPLDYNFKSIEPKYLIGMSVPPVMTAQIANQIWIQWLSKIKENGIKTA